MLRKCEEDPGFCQNTVKQPLGSRKNTEAVQHFLIVTRRGQRPRTQKQREKEQKRCRDEARNLKDDRFEGKKEEE